MSGWPLVLSMARLLLVIPLVMAIRRPAPGVAAVVIGLAAISDLADGWLARRARTASVAGGYLDVGVDMAFIIGGVWALVSVGVHPGWLLGVVIVMAGQFVVSSRRGTVGYDPVGKYFGAAMYGVLFGSVVMVDFAIWMSLALGAAALAAISLVSRYTWLLGSRRRAAE